MSEWLSEFNVNAAVDCVANIRGVAEAWKFQALVRNLIFRIAARLRVRF